MSCDTVEMRDAPLTIVHLLLTRRFAGTERHVVELANAQAAQGHAVTVILRRDGARDRPDAIAQRFSPEVKKIVVGNWLGRWQARRWLRRLRPDVAHAHLSAGCRALKGLPPGVTRRIATLHIHYKPQQHEGLDGLIAIAPWQLAAIPEAMRARTVHIDNWSLSRPAAADARARLRQAYGIAPDAFVFGALGRVEASKGLDVLLAAWQAAALPDDARLVIAGQGKAWAALRQQAAAEVVMPGFVSQPQDWLAAFDVFVSAARSEPFGLVLLEAMHAGLPILASQSQGAQHLAAWIAAPLQPVGDVAALAAALRHTYASRPARRTYPMQAFALEGKLAEVEAFYRRVTPASPA